MFGPTHSSRTSSLTKMRVSKGLYALIILKQLFNFIEAELIAGKCPEIEETLQCNEHFPIKSQWTWTPLSFLASDIIAHSMSLFAFNFTSLDNKRGLFNCNNNNGPVYAHQLQVSIVTENLSPLGITMNINNGIAVPCLKSIPVECNHQYGSSSSYNYFVRYQKGNYLLIFGCLQLTETLHDRGFWIFDVTHGKTDNLMIIKKALLDANLTEVIDLENNRNVYFRNSDNIDAGKENGMYFYDHCYNNSELQAFGAFKHMPQLEVGLLLTVTIIGAAIFVLMCFKLICK